MQAVKNSREERIIEWANYVRTHKDWKKIHTDFINAQFIKSRNFFKRLLKTSGGREKIELLMKKHL